MGNFDGGVQRDHIEASESIRMVCDGFKENFERLWFSL